MFLHEQGYTYFTIPGLTYAEINVLVTGYNRKEKKKSRAMKKARKSRR